MGSKAFNNYMQRQCDLYDESEPEEEDPTENEQTLMDQFEIDRFEAMFDSVDDYSN